MIVALCLQTCDRFELTARTLETLAAHNDLKEFRLLHADDASADPDAMRALTMSYGFRTVVQTHERLGCTMVRWALISAAARRGADWILLLENDIETLRPFPWPLFEYVVKRKDVTCLRLYGRYKDAERKDPCLTTHKHKGHALVKWRPLKGAPESAQIGEIHWSAQPAVTKAQELLNHHRYGTDPQGWTVRVKKNVMAHIGAERTPGRVV